ncbi:MAG: SAM-dependent chlorinase/fluorinase [Bacteroidetes bacterium]|nr:SAM-dependent chlorinase/fluorinase [Bacteroidota bacterium]HET6243079.1 SAM-dependent chlorinase/fluorinase [Bacteroidia bacterium]
MSVITLTTDLGLKDHYVAAIKGAVYTLIPDAVIVDISHQLIKFDTGSAAFLIKNSFRSFPNGSVHIIGLNDEHSPNEPYLAVQSENHFFVGKDNGVFSLILEDLPAKIALIETENKYAKFPVKEIFVKAACHLAKGGKLEDLGGEIGSFAQKMELVAFIEKDTIRGAIIYIDSYGNLITNITRDHFMKMGETRPFLIDFGINHTINTISRTYSEISEGEIVAVFNSSGNLEIAINKGPADTLLGLKLRSTIRIEFQ